MDKNRRPDREDVALSIYFRKRAKFMGYEGPYEIRETHNKIIRILTLDGKVKRMAVSRKPISFVREHN